ncbi:hypothetical protein BC826DRAFT_969102 [Russula brevipes]|nr:hypothetical protein BC826DRAFT_969102 [Russula brevipes]
MADTSLPGNTCPAAGVSWGATPHPAPQRPQSPPSSYRHTVPDQLRGHAATIQSAVLLPVNAASYRRPDGHWGAVPSPLPNLAAQGEPQDLQYMDMSNHDMVHYRPSLPTDLAPPNLYLDRGTNNYARVASAATQSVAPPAPGNHGHAAQHAAEGPAQAFPDGWPHRGPVPNDPAAEVLRRLASRYLHQPGSEVYMVHIELVPTRRFRVVITLELADL